MANHSKLREIYKGTYAKRRFDDGGSAYTSYDSGPSPVDTSGMDSLYLRENSGAPTASEIASLTGANSGTIGVNGMAPGSGTGVNAPITADIQDSVQLLTPQQLGESGGSGSGSGSGSGTSNAVGGALGSLLKSLGVGSNGVSSAAALMSLLGAAGQYKQNKQYTPTFSPPPLFGGSASSGTTGAPAASTGYGPAGGYNYSNYKGLTGNQPGLGFAPRSQSTPNIPNYYTYGQSPQQSFYSTTAPVGTPGVPMASKKGGHVKATTPQRFYGGGMPDFTGRGGFGGDFNGRGGFGAMRGPQVRPPMPQKPPTPTAPRPTLPPVSRPLPPAPAGAGNFAPAQPTHNMMPPPLPAPGGSPPTQSPWQQPGQIQVGGSVGTGFVMQPPSSGAMQMPQNPLSFLQAGAGAIGGMAGTPASANNAGIAPAVTPGMSGGASPTQLPTAGGNAQSPSVAGGLAGGMMSAGLPPAPASAQPGMAGNLAGMMSTGLPPATGPTAMAGGGSTSQQPTLASSNIATGGGSPLAQVLAANARKTGQPGARPFAGGGSDVSRHVQGPGDGTSDSIPARLANGEYVIDAQTVSMLGNGDNGAGAKVLDSMRHNVRKHKGAALAKGQMAPDAKPIHKYMGGN